FPSLIGIEAEPVAPRAWYYEPHSHHFSFLARLRVLDKRAELAQYIRTLWPQVVRKASCWTIWMPKSSPCSRTTDADRRWRWRGTWRSQRARSASGSSV